jgi:hypothetical protein
MDWWIGGLFASGSTCFATAAIVSQWASAPRPGIGVTYFAGSLCFTAAAHLQYRQAAGADRASRLAALIQLIGTLCFNVSTFAGMRHGFDAKQADLRVWTPDAFGSACFLVASEIAYAQICRRWACVRLRSRAWRIAAINLAGSLAFGVSAVTSLVEPSTQEPVSARITNAATAVGALCFLAGAVMLLPRRDHPIRMRLRRIGSRHSTRSRRGAFRCVAGWRGWANPS